MRDKLNGLLIVVDGLVHTIYEDMLRQGDLPNISEHIKGRSIVEAEQTFSCHPSETLTSMQALNTGQFPFTPGAVVYHPKTRSVMNYIGRHRLSAANCEGRQTIFDLIEGRTASFYNPWHDGVSDPHPSWMYVDNLPHIFGFLSDVSNRVAVRRFARTLQEQPIRFAEIYFYAYDRFGHTIKTERGLKRKYRRLDQHIGRIIQELKKSSGPMSLENTIVTFLSDHSMSEVRHSLDFRDICRRAGFKPGTDSLAFAYGYSIGQLYTLKPIPRLELESKIYGLLAHKAVEHIIIKQEEGVLVYSNSSFTSIRKQNGKYQMQILSGSNPFGYDEKTCQRLSQPHTTKESLEWTFTQEQPDAIVGIYESMTHPDCPQIRVLASPGYDFGATRNPKELVGSRVNGIRTHGTLHREHSRVPLIIAGPQGIIEPRTVQYARAIDYMPTLLELMGEQVPSNLDGQNLIPL